MSGLQEGNVTGWFYDQADPLGPSITVFSNSQPVKSLGATPAIVASIQNADSATEVVQTVTKVIAPNPKAKPTVKR